jgi:hypothetical protein
LWNVLTDLTHNKRETLLKPIYKPNNFLTECAVIDASAVFLGLVVVIDIEIEMEVEVI